MILSATDSSTTKLYGIVYSHHGGLNLQAWWYQNRNDKLPFNSPDGKLNHVDVKKSISSIYVKVVSQYMD